MTSNPVASLRRFLRPPPQREERCELCSVRLNEDHSHLVEPEARRLVCVCEACAILFDQEGAGKYRRVRQSIQSLSDFRADEATWAGLGLPVNLAFFMHSSAAGEVVAVYPSPGGATEAAVDPEAWEQLVRDNPGLGRLQPDVEALLVNRAGGARDYFRVGIDECYRLVGIIRTHWTGFSGGAAWDEIGRFFERLRERNSGRPSLA